MVLGFEQKRRDWDQAFIYLFIFLDQAFRSKSLGAELQEKD